MVQVLFLQNFNAEGLSGPGWNAQHKLLKSFKIGDEALVYHVDGFDWIEKDGEKFSIFFLYLLQNKIVQLK